MFSQKNRKKICAKVPPVLRACHIYCPQNKVVYFCDKSFMLSRFILLIAVFCVAVLLYYIDLIHDK